MQPLVIKGLLLQHPEGVPQYANQEEYIMMRIVGNSLADYHSVPWANDDTWRRSCIECSAYLAANPGTSLVEDAANGDGEKLLEIAIRHLSGCGGFDQDIDIALSYLHTIIDSNNEDPAINVPAELLVKAISCAACAHFELAAVYANAAIARGLSSPISLSVSAVLSSWGARCNVDVRNSPRYRVYKSLWRARDKLDEEMAAAERRRSTKVAKTPNAYKCAADGCGVEGTSKAALLRCGGQCPSEEKPSYCSKKCQKRDWRTHKKVCKRGSDAETAPPTNSDPVVVLDPEVDDPSTLDNEISTEGGVERLIEFPHSDMPGGKVTIVSKHLSPVYLRYLKEALSVVGAQ
ncbi:hypothetical protein C8R45DRAFT_910988 [Mycena sanguinolenta]|nr:hypothetical protein C8R45DRAFT_910988 [Mycena sanguinolenta]